MIFAHLYVTLCWNLMSRSISVSSLKYQHITWQNDALIISIPKHKGDQEGAHVYGKHVYANPTNPAVCPILALGIYVLCNSFRAPNCMQSVFEGNEDTNENRFSKWLQNMVQSPDIHDSIRRISKEIGSHSFRKGAATHAASVPSGPSAVYRCPVTGPRYRIIKVPGY